MAVAALVPARPERADSVPSHPLPALCRLFSLWWRRGAGWGHAGGMGTSTLSDLLEGHVVLDIECLDRLFLNGYVPKLQAAGQVAGFMTRHSGLPIPSPAIMEKIGTSFGRAV